MTDPVARILRAVRRLDAATTLRGILDTLAEATAAEGLRVAVLLVDRGHLRVYRRHGFRPGDLPAEVPVAASVTLSEAVTRCQPVPIGGSRTPDPSGPAFTRPAPGRAGLVLPLVVDQSAVALVFVDWVQTQGLDDDDPRADTPKWSDIVEVLVRHGSARLESVTSQRTVEALTTSS